MTQTVIGKKSLSQLDQDTIAQIDADNIMAKQEDIAAANDLERTLPDLQLPPPRSSLLLRSSQLLRSSLLSRSPLLPRSSLLMRLRCMLLPGAS